jgi:aryl-alcohol dehydrogenase-like predicted oxidoreductase
LAFRQIIQQAAVQYTRLGNSDIEVSRICLGSMTWGEQNTEAEALQQLNYALGEGVNFIDTAEMYPIPPKAGTQGRTETYIGHWLAERGKRDDVVIATKVAGPASWMAHLRGGPQLNRTHIEQAVNDSLQRLQTDYIDLYQVHWPARNTNYFGKLGYRPEQESSVTTIEETLDALDDLVRQGKVRTIGLSNETPWGAAQYLRLADAKQQARIVSIQNPYSLLNRSFEIGLAEFAHREGTGLLAYSPLGFGVLSGKYLDDSAAVNARLRLFRDYTRYSNEQGVAATQAYVELARDNNLDPAQMALAFILQQPFTTSVIIGATTMLQLQANIASCHVQLDDDIIAAINDIHRNWSNPCP